MKSDEEELQKAVMGVSLEGYSCALFHLGKLPQAVDYIMQDIGFRKEAQARLAIPVCEECLAALQSDEWILLYCLNCNQSRWVNKNLTKRMYLYENAVNDILWLDRCPECTDKNLKNNK